jgi:hypothetical protein
MSAIPALTPDECYLAAILDDPSGIELAEFCWVDEESYDGCFRLWDFQWMWFRCEETFQIDWCGRSLGKSTGIIMRAFAFPFNFAGAEMLITAPQLNHLRPVTDKIENLFLQTRLGFAMLPKQRGNGINHQPQFQAHFINNARIISRLPSLSGQGMKGMHPLVVESDEMQDFPPNGWTEIIETMKAASKGAQWRAHGVSRGVRDKYYAYTMRLDPDMPFYVHRYMAMHRPTWSVAERKSKIAQYNGTDADVDYRRNIYGDHGDATNPVFVLARLMECVRIAQDKWAVDYNENVYSCLKITDELVRRAGQIEPFLSIPANHLDDVYYSYWGGMDCGFTKDPSELLIFGEIEPKKGAPPMLRLLLRIHMQRIAATDQAQVVRWAFEQYGKRLRSFTFDKSGNGLPLWQELDPASAGATRQNWKTPDHIINRVKGYNFSQKVAVEFDDRALTGDEKPEDAVIKKNIVDYATDELRKLVDARPGRMELPNDRELLSEFQGQEIQYTRDEGSAAGITRRYTGGSFHTLDAAKMMIAGRNLDAIEKALKTPIQTPVLDRFGF